jgi:pimeloyl-ACP methyl ester carboxylesterase
LVLFFKKEHSFFLMRRRHFGDIAAIEFGPPSRTLDVLFLHANGFNALTYRQALDADLRVLALDLRGHGRTTLPTHAQRHAWQVYADDVLAVLASLGEAPTVLAGHSMGGATVLLAAPRVTAARVVLFDPVVAADAFYAPGRTPSPDQPLAQAALRRKPRFASRAAAAAAYRGRGAFRTWPDAVLEDYLQDGLRDLPDGGVELACAPAWEAANFAAFAMSDPRVGLRAGVRVLRAELGSTCALDPAAAAAAGVRLESVPGTTHFLPMERPDTVQAALREAVCAC